MTCGPVVLFPTATPSLFSATAGVQRASSSPQRERLPFGESLLQLGPIEEQALGLERSRVVFPT